MVDDRTALMSARALSQGYEILWYTIDRVLGQGGFGITYLAHDRNLDRSVAIKEYLPTSFAYRRDDYSINPITGDHRESFIWGLNSFQKEAQTLARFSHPNIVRVNSVFEANNTAYMVMEYEHGQSLSAYYKNNYDRREQSFLEQIFFPIFDGLKEIHKFDFIHRDIKPDNIYIRDDQTPVLIDFGSARQTSTQQNTEMTSLISLGYTPLEQYSVSYGDQGPWTDIYALAATIYEGIVGSKPDESLSRSACLLRANPDLVAPLYADEFPEFSQPFLDAVYAGLRLEPEARPQSIEEWSHQFKTSGGGSGNNSNSSGFTVLESDRTRLKPTHRSSQHDSNEWHQFNEDGHYSDDTVAGRSNQSLSSTGFGVDADSRDDRMHDQSDQQPFDELLNFDDDESFVGNANAVRPTNDTSKRNQPANSKWRGPMAAVAVVLALLSVGAGYMYYTSTTPSTQPQTSPATASTPTSITLDMSVAAIDKMPRPPVAITTTLSKDSVLEQLGYLANMAPLLTQAYSIDSANSELLETIQHTENSLFSMANKWNATRYTDVASQIKAVSDAMPAAAHDQDRIQSILDASDQVLAYDHVFAILDSKSYLQPSGNSVLDKISIVNIDDYQRLKSTLQWQQMMKELSQSAMDKLAKSEFDDVAKLTEAALSLDADHPGFNALRLFLAGS